MAQSDDFEMSAQRTAFGWEERTRSAHCEFCRSWPMLSKKGLRRRANS